MGVCADTGVAESSDKFVRGLVVGRVTELVTVVSRLGWESNTRSHPTTMVDIATYGPGSNPTAASSVRGYLKEEDGEVEGGAEEDGEGSDFGEED